MSAARRILEEALALSEEERLELASELLASVDGPAEPDWDTAWLKELDARLASAKANGGTGSDWAEARARILKRIGRD